MLISATGVSADGMVIYQPDPYSDGWEYSDESSQRALISFQDGLEKMAVSVNIGGVEDKNAVWLFPVPASPEKVVIDVVGEFPEVYGADVASKAKNNLSGIKDTLFGTQIYPILSSLFGYRDYRYFGMSDMTLSAGMAKGAPMAEAVALDVVVYEHLDKEGLSSEIITAKTANGIYDYFKGKGLKVEKGMIPALDAYIGKEYSFVASWIDNGPAADDWVSVNSRQYIEQNIEAYMGMPNVQAKLAELGQEYPELALGDEGIQDVASNYKQLVPYLESDEGAVALGKLVDVIQSDSSLGSATRPSSQLVDDWSGNGASNSGYSSSAWPSMALPPDYDPADYWSDPVGDDNIKGILVYFPTDDIYFPLLPTSVYESKAVPATIKVIGYVDPRIYKNIENFSKVSYYTDAYYQSSGEIAALDTLLENTDPTHYTKIEINAPSKYLTEDLWMRNQAPVVALYPAIIADYPLAVSLVLLVLCSLAAVFTAGMILLNDLRAKPGKLALLGMANCLTLIGLAAAALHIGGGQTTTKEEIVLLEKIRLKGYFGKRKRAAAYFAAAVLVLLFMVAGSSGLVSVYYNLGYYVNYQAEMLLGLVFLYLPPVLAFFGWRVAQVAPEDKALFADLKARGYSTWSFKPRNRRTWLFIALFSAVFLLFSAVSVWLLKIGIR